jgi:hypothetical protein
VFESVGIPAYQTRYARLFVNGGYYLYALEEEHIDEELLQRVYAKEPIGDLYGCNSIRWDEGPWGWGDFRQLAPFCGYTDVQRYSFTYERKTLEWKNNDDFVALLRGFHTARAAGDATLRAYLAANFDVDLVLRYIAVINWAGAWDDDYHNYLLYRRTGGKWMMMSSDLNWTLLFPTVDVATNVTTFNHADKSLYLGLEGDPDNWRNRWHYLKDAFLRVYRTEYDDTLRKIGPMALAPQVVSPIVDEATQAFEASEAKNALSAGTCDDAVAEGAQIKMNVATRYAVLRQRLGF